jgi:hypothetical protein
MNDELPVIPWMGTPKMHMKRGVQGYRLNAEAEDQRHGTAAS